MKGIEMNASNTRLLKLNQIGFVSEAFRAAIIAFWAELKIAASHRSAEIEQLSADLGFHLQWNC